MPLYHFICENCSYEFEELLPYSQRGKPTAEPCPDCAGKVKSKITNASYHSKDTVYNAPEGKAMQLAEKQLGKRINNVVPASDIISNAHDPIKYSKIENVVKGNIPDPTYFNTNNQGQPTDYYKKDKSENKVPIPNPYN